MSLHFKFNCPQWKKVFMHWTVSCYISANIWSREGTGSIPVLYTSRPAPHWHTSSSWNPHLKSSSTSIKCNTIWGQSVQTHGHVRPRRIFYMSQTGRIQRLIYNHIFPFQKCLDVSKTNTNKYQQDFVLPREVFCICWHYSVFYIWH